MYRGDKKRWYVSIAKDLKYLRAHAHTCTSTCTTQTYIHMRSNFWFIYFSPRTTVNTFVFLWAFKALWLWHIALGVILMWAQNQWASVWQGFTVLKHQEKHILNQPSFKLYQASYDLNHKLPALHNYWPVASFWRRLLEQSLSSEECVITRAYISFSEKDMLIYIYGPWQSYCIQSHCISKKQKSPPNVQISALNPLIVSLSAYIKQ